MNYIGKAQLSFTIVAPAEWEAAAAFENLAIIEACPAGTDRLKKVARLWGIAEMLSKVWGSMYRLEDSESEIAAAREQLGAEAFSTAWVEGGKMSFDKAIAYAFESNEDTHRYADG
jgi:hypothetical protein